MRCVLLEPHILISSTHSVPVKKSLNVVQYRLPCFRKVWLKHMVWANSAVATHGHLWWISHGKHAYSYMSREGNITLWIAPVSSNWTTRTPPPTVPKFTAVELFHKIIESRSGSFFSIVNLNKFDNHHLPNVKKNNYVNLYEYIGTKRNKVCKTRITVII